MSESILNTVKNFAGIDSTYNAFDTQIIACTNAVLSTLYQIGIGPNTPVIVTSQQETWSQLIGTSQKLEAVKAYVGFKVRMMFDPPTSSAVSEAINNTINELEWRLKETGEGL